MIEASPEMDLIKLKPLELWLCAIVLLACVALHFPAVYNRLGLPVEAALSLLSFATPISGMLFLSAAQVIPDPPASPLSSSQLALVGFLVWYLIRRFDGLNRSDNPLIHSFRPFLFSVAPFFVWTAGMNLMHGDDLKTTLLLTYAIMTGCAAAMLVGQSRNRLMTCLAAFLAGQLLAATVFCMIKLHLGEPVQAFKTEIYGDSTAEGALRIGTARGNAGMLAGPMALVIMGAIGYLIASRSRETRGPWLTMAIAIVALVIATSAMLGSGSRGPIVALAGGVVFFVVANMAASSLSLKSLVVLLLAGLLFAIGWTRFGLQDNWNHMADRQQDEAAEHGTTLAGRDYEWQAAWQCILNSPITGGAEVQVLSYQGNEEFWASHSTYLDAGLQGGIPALALFGWFTLKPLVRLWNRRREFAVGILLGVYFVTALINSEGSAMQVKYFWILWGIAAACFPAAVPRVRTLRKRSAMELEAAGRRQEMEAGKLKVEG